MDDSWGDEDIPDIDLEFDDDLGDEFYVSDLDLCRQRAREEFLTNISGGGEEEGEEEDDFDTCLVCPEFESEDEPSLRDFYTVDDYYAENDVVCDEEEEEPEPEEPEPEEPADKECKVTIMRGGEVVSSGSTPKPAGPSVDEETRECQNNYIVEDQYYPGLIDDAVHKKVNFYQTSFDLSFGDEIPADAPENPPLSLVEAFDMRVNREQGARKKIIKEGPAPKTSPAKVQSEKEKQNFMGFLKDQREINRDEVKLANVAHVELTTIVQNKPLNDLMKAINCLLKAQLMNEYDKSLQAAEEAYQSAPPELAESAAVQKATNFVTEELSKKKTVVPSSSKSYRPIEIVSYVGITKPILEEPELTQCK